MRRSRMDLLTDIESLLEELSEIISLPQGPHRVARVQQLSGCQFLHLLDDCRIRLAEVGLKTTDLPETDPE